MQIAVIVVLMVYVDYPLLIWGEKLTLSIFRNLPIAAYALHILCFPKEELFYFIGRNL